MRNVFVIYLMLAFVSAACMGPKGDQGDSIVGPPGQIGPPGRDGVDGRDGTDGAKGDKGEKGDKGDPGNDGSNAAPTPYTVTEIIDPCGDAPGIVDEVLLKMVNGDVLVFFTDNSNGKNGRLSVLSNGTYMTTDGSNCVFNLNSGVVSF